MPTYLVRWEMVQQGDTAREAAQAVRARYFQLRSGADQFDVVDTSSDLAARFETVDLTTPSNDSVEYHFSPRLLHLMARRLHLDGATTEEVLDMLEKPQNWPELVTQVITDIEFDKVSATPETPDYSV